MLTQIAKRNAKIQILAISLAASVAVTGGVALITSLDLRPSGNSDSITVRQIRPTFHRPADRTGISSNDTVEATAPVFHLPTDRVRPVGGVDESPVRTNRPLDRGVGGR